MKNIKKFLSKADSAFGRCFTVLLAGIYLLSAMTGCGSGAKKNGFDTPVPYASDELTSLLTPYTAASASPFITGSAYATLRPSIVPTNAPDFPDVSETSNVITHTPEVTAAATTDIVDASPSAKPTDTVAPIVTYAPTAEPAEFTGTLNYFAIPDAIKSELSNADIAAYKKLVPAYLGYKTSITFEAGDKIRSLPFLIELCFPIFFCDIDESSIIYGDSTVSWRYTTGKTEHDYTITRFENIIKDYLELLRSSDSTAMKCLVLYKKYTNTVEYDYPTSDYYEGLNDSYTGELYDHCFDAFLNKRGVCWCYARGYSFLLNQAGIEALTVSADGGIGHHEWTLLKLDGKWYYADPTWDNSGSLSFFGFTSDARKSYGYTVENSHYFAGADYPISGVFNVTDTRFFDLYTGICFGERYELDRENNRILFYSYSPQYADYVVTSTFNL